ncbi:MAG: trypsin-like peptidase domain-containing protein [Bacteroidales bacterium]|nr:trypsin-like peptidase domain-containing protein [Candidatus Cacconaster equifaecalis]
MRKIIYFIICIAASAAVGYYAAEIAIERSALQSGTLPAEKVESSRRQTNSHRPFSSDTPNLADAAESSVGSVVYVKVVQKARIQNPNSFFDMLFGFAQIPQDQVGLGSGVIIDSDGYIVTNNHVIAGADLIEVTLENNKVYPATLVGTDPATDIALLKIEADGLQAITLGNSDDLRLGEWVLAIGSPYDLRSTITAGIVSAKGRSLPNYDGQYRVESFIQTDAAVNPGNSGGALVNALGELVGINTSIISLTGSYAGYSFAVPVNIVKKITDDFREYGQVQRAMLGVTVTGVTSELARKTGLDIVEGVYVTTVQGGSVAERSGIREGDVIVEINLNKIVGTATLQEQMSRLRPGEQAVFTIVRDGKKKELIVTL